MQNHPIPDELRSNHLFLLVGTNPLPDWVAAKLLLRDGGQLYLMHSQTTSKVAKRLWDYACAAGMNKPESIWVADPYDPDSVSTAVKDMLGKITSDSIGLNYTGGTKVMAVHGHRAITQAFSNKAVLSYLEAPRSVMHFEPVEPHFPRGHQVPVGMAEDVRFTFEELFKLHGSFKFASPTKIVKAPKAAQALIDLHGTFRGQSAWRQECDKSLKDRNKFKSPTALAGQMIPLYGQPANILKDLCPGASTDVKRLGDVLNEPGCEFNDVQELAEWLDGMWLEHHVLACLKQDADKYGIGKNYGRNVRPFIGKIDFELDVAALRGYRLHAISCHTGSSKPLCKQKLFEVFTRARQLGGDEARAALVCCYDAPSVIEEEIGEVWNTEDRVKVFGRAELKTLGEHLEKWFKG